MVARMEEMNEPIYDVAVECEKLFEIQIARFNQANDRDGAALIAELNHQFLTWASSMRVFADGDLSLDRKLQGHAEIQDQVLRGLDLIEANLAYVHMRDVSSEREEAGGSSLDQSLRLSIENVEAVSEALKRLHQIGMIIRYSSTASQARRARKHTEGLDLSSFTQLAALSLKSLFSLASTGLLEQLTISMTDTYRMFLYRRGKAESQQIQPQQRASRLPTILEDPAHEERLEEAARNNRPSQGMPTDVPQTFQQLHSHPMAPQSRPTTIDSREAASRLGRLLRPSAQRNAASILASHVDYPKPAEGSNKCDWCFSYIPEDTFQGDNWKEHVNEDHRPFVCMSEKCMESLSLPRFPKSSTWLQHMLDAHGTEWHRRVHPPSQWRCPLCDDNSITFGDSEQLLKHFEETHKEVSLTDQQRGTIERQSRTSYLRPQNECPLCCLPIEDDEDFLQRIGKGNDNKRNASDRTSGSESEKKRLKTRTGQQTSTLPIDEGGPKMSSPTTLAPEVIAQHVAGHLRTIMLLTLRIISIDGPVEVSSDKESVSGKTDDQLSRVASSRDDLGERSDISATSSYPGELAEGYQLQHLEDTVPDHDEIITWDDVCGKEDVRVDDILQPAVKQGAFQSWTNSKDERSLYEKDEQAPLDTEAYAIAWRAFERRLSKREQHLSQRAFQWVLCSHDSLSTPELSMAMLIDPNSDEVDELNGEAERLLRKGGIKDLCGSLLSLDPEHDIWGFKHHAAADYFTANHCDYSQACAFVGMACLKFLITDPCVANKTNCWCKGNANTTPSPRCSFIRAHVMRHLRQADQAPTSHDKRLAVLEKRFFGSPESSSIVYQTWAQSWAAKTLSDRICLEPVFFPLFAMAAFGLVRLLADWWLDPRVLLYASNKQGHQLQTLADVGDQDRIFRLVQSRPPTVSPEEFSSSSVPTHDDYHISSINSRSEPGGGRPGSLASASQNRSSRLASTEFLQSSGDFGFLFIINKLRISQPEMDIYGHRIPPRSPNGYAGEIPSKVMRYSNSKLSEALGYRWYRESSNDMGSLHCVDASGNFMQNPSRSSYRTATEYKRFAVFACNPLLPIMVTNSDPLVRDTANWELLQIFHPRRTSSLSQVVTLDSPMGDGVGPVRHVAGRLPRWMPALLPQTYSSPLARSRPSHGLGGELGIILGLMALTANVDHHGNDEVSKVFLESHMWHRNEWRGPKTPSGHPPTAQDNPNGFLVIVFLDPENPHSTQESLRWFEWLTPIVRG